MATIDSLVSYGSGSDEENADNVLESVDNPPNRAVDIKKLKSKFLLNSAPGVTAKVRSFKLSQLLCL